jgi:hypothetical protein
MNHPLDGAYVRLDRAQEHLAELKGIVDKFIGDEYMLAHAMAQLNPEPGVPFLFIRPESPIPHRIPLLVGETVHNLRASLDYLIYELALFDSGATQNGTQFLIEDSPENFQRRCKSHLKGVNATHAAAIEALQPYNGVNWTKLLRTISNPDKHRHLVVQQHNSGVVAKISQNLTDMEIPPAPVKGVWLTGVAEFADGTSPVYVQLHVTLFIALDDGFPVIETLEQIQTDVANTLASFKSEFQT